MAKQNQPNEKNEIVVNETPTQKPAEIKDFDVEIFQQNSSLGALNEEDQKAVLNGLQNYLQQEHNVFAVLMLEHFHNPKHCTAYVGNSAQADAINAISKGLFQIPKDTIYAMVTKKQ